MLKRIRLTDFKSFVDEQVELAPLTLLVGANASGKSNFLDAIRFLGALTFEMSLAEILNGEDRAAPDAWPGIRGRAPEVARLGTTSFAVESTWLPPLLGGHSQIELTHRLVCLTSPQPLLTSQSLSAADGKVLFNAGSQTEEQIEADWSERRRFRMGRSPLLGGHGFPPFPPDGFPIALDFADTLMRIRLLNIQPGEMRGYGKRSHELGDDGKNISGVLAVLFDDPAQRPSLVSWLAELCAPELEDIDFIEVKELEDVMAVLVEKGGERVSIRSASDGTLRFLGMLVALRTAAPDSTVLIEDIEAGLHPTRIRLLVEYLQSVARERRLQIIATTHSPTVLEWLDDETLRSVIVFGRVPEQKGTLMRRLGDLPHFGEVVERKGIEELFTTGWLEMAL
jgi:hypothetical protein